MRRPLVKYDFAPDPFWIPYIWGKLYFLFFQSTSAGTTAGLTRSYTGKDHHASLVGSLGLTRLRPRPVLAPHVLRPGGCRGDGGQNPADHVERGRGDWTIQGSWKARTRRLDYPADHRERGRRDWTIQRIMESEDTEAGLSSGSWRARTLRLASAWRLYVWSILRGGGWKRKSLYHLQREGLFKIQHDVQ